jgi:SSS family solute:Na+ symporter
MTLTTLDLVIFISYVVAMMAIGLLMARSKKTENSEDYFLAGKELPWWAVGGSLIASNISAEQMIGMAGSGFVIGMAISSYELMAAATLLVVAKFFLPAFVKNKITTMPQFVERRFDGRVRTGLAVFWVMLFIFVNITSLFYLGGLAISKIMDVPLTFSIIGLAIYSASFSIFGGLRVVVWTDVIQVIVLVFGGTMASYMALNALSGGEGVIAGMEELFRRAPEKFNMIFDKDDTYVDIQTGKTESSYALLPGIAVLIGGMWIANLYYWGINQYIIQRALAAKSIQEAQKGLVFAAFIKVFMPFIVVLPGIVAFVMQADIQKADEAYPWILSNYVTSGFRGIALAALVAAIGSSISSMANSASTIYTLDIHRVLIRKNVSEKSLVKIGQITAAATLVIGVLMTPLLENFGQVFQFIQEYTGFVSPGILCIFMFGLFWKRTTTNAALVVLTISIPLSLALKFFFPEWAFLNRMGVCFLLLSLIMIVISYMGPAPSAQQKELAADPADYKTTNSFNILSIILLSILAAIYAILW